MSVLAAIMVALAVLLATASTSRSSGESRKLLPQSAWLLAPAIGFLLVVVLDGQTLVLALLALAVAAGVLRLVQRAAANKVAAAFADRVLEACDSISADLSVGQPPQVALDRVASRWAEFAPVAVAGRVGADVPEAMRALSLRRGGRPLQRIAATWQVASRTGGGLADALETAAASIRTERRIQRLVETELSGARATARLLAVLPFGVLLMGQGIGGRPFHFLFATPIGLGCLAAGAALTLAGLFWMDRIAAKVLAQ